MKKIKTLPKYIILLLISLIFLLPVIYMIALSFMGNSETAKMLDCSSSDFKELKLIPDMFSLEQYYQVFFRRPDYLLKFWNSVICTVPAVIGQVIVCSLASFAFGKLKFKGRDTLFFIYIILLLLPSQVILVPNYMVFDKLGILNSFLSIIFPGMFSALGVCILRQSVKYISDASIEAARIDGASYMKIFLKIILPQIKGGLVTLTLLCFIDNYNLVSEPLAYFSDANMYPLSVAMSEIGGNDTGVVFACGVMFMIPPLLIYLIGAGNISSPFNNGRKE